MPRWLWGVLLVAGWASPLQAQVGASLEVSATSLGVNDQLTLTIALSGSDLGAVEQPDLSGLEGFRVVAGPSVSTQFQWINGSASSSKSFSYVLLPLQQGDFTLGPFKVLVGRDTVTTNSVQVKVVAGSTSLQPAPRRRGGWQQPSLLDEPDAAAQSIGDEVFVAAEPDRLRAYPGQQITLSYKVYTQLSISGLELKESPSLKGFWVEDIEVPRVPSPVIEQVRGRQYSVFVVKKQALFATSPGQLQIPVSTVALGVRVRSNDPFSFFSLGMTEPVYRRTQPVDITIVAFPTAGRPANFRNLTGRFSISSKLDKTEAKTGDAIALTVSLSGTGNLNTIGEIDLPSMDEFKIFSSKSGVKSNRGGDLIEGTKTWEYVIVPQAPGNHTIAPITVTYFDPETERYRTASTDPLTIRVGRAEGDSARAQRMFQPSQRRLTRQGSDINFIKLAVATIDDQSKGWHTSPLFYLVLLLPVAANAGIFIYQRQSEKLAGDVALQRKRRAARHAAEELKMASKHLKRGNLTEFHSTLGTALSTFVADRFDLPAIDLTRDQIQQRLTELGLAAETVAQTVGLLERCDFARFAPSQATAQAAQGMLDDAKRVLDQLERSAS